MKLRKKLGLGLFMLLALLVAGSSLAIFGSTQKALADTPEQVVAAQNSVAFCTHDRYWEDDDYYAGDEALILAYCNPANAAELGAACDGDVRDLDPNKYYIGDSFFADLCGTSAQINPETLTTAGPDNPTNPRDLDNDSTQGEGASTPLDNIVRQMRSRMGCYDPNTFLGIPECSYNVARIVEICRSNTQLSQHPNMVSGCNQIRTVYGVDDFGGGTTEPTDPDGDGGPVDRSADCEDQGFLAFIACPIIESIDDGIGWIEKNVANILYLEPDEYQGNDYAVREAWVIFRNISSILLVIVMLIMVISTALGFGLFDAYTVKKMLPRLVIGAILIQLSWGLMTFAITLTNTIGAGIFGLMLAPFGGAAATDLPSLITAQEAEGGAGFFMMIVTFTAGAGGVLLGIAGLLSLALTVFLIVLVGFIILVARQLVIVLTLILAPVALVAWIMPGADKGYKLWWDSFSKALMMYPIIMILFAGGRILAWIAIKSNTNDSLDIGFLGTGTALQLMLVIIAYVVPYFMIPFTLRFAGGLVATLGGFANDKGRGVFDRLRKGRQETMSDRLTRAQENRLWDQNKGGWKGAIAKRANTLASIGTSNPWDTARLYAGTAGGKKVMNQINAGKLDHTRKMAEAMGKAGITIDKGLQAIAGEGEYRTVDANGNVSEVQRIGNIRNQKDLDNAIRVMSTSVNEDGSIDHQTRAAALQLQNASQFILGANEHPEYGRGSIQGAALMNWSAQGFANEDQIVRVANRIGEEDNSEIGISIGQEASYLGYSKGGRQDLKPTYAAVAGKDSKGRDILIEAPEDRKVELAKSLKGFEMGSAKSKAVKVLAPRYDDIIQTGRSAAKDSQEYLEGQAAEKTMAHQAMSATDLKSRAEWIRQSKLTFKPDVDRLVASGMSEDDAFEKVLYDKAYGRGGFNPGNPQQQQTPPTP